MSNSASSTHSIRSVSSAEFMAVSSDKAIERRGKELRIFLDCLSHNPSFLKRVAVFASPTYKDHAPFQAWFAKPETRDHLFECLYGQVHRIGSKWGDWRNGGMGSRWLDVRINNYDVRIAYYSRATNPKMFASVPVSITQGKDHILMLMDYFEGTDCESKPHLNWDCEDGDSDDEYDEDDEDDEDDE